MDILNKVKDSIKSNFNTLKEWASSPIFLSIASYVSLLVAYFVDSILLLLISLGLVGYAIYLAFKFED
tara:strand:+ start:1392 stop:1595 length:204 start_codon:yes stop_codon:yes gene_type:complete